MASVHGEGILLKCTETMGGLPAGTAPNCLRKSRLASYRVNMNVAPLVVSAAAYVERVSVHAEKTGLDLKGKTVEAACQLARPVSQVAFIGMHGGQRSPAVVQASLVVIATMEAFWRVKKACGESERSLMVCGGALAVHSIRHRCWEDAGRVAATFVSSLLHFSEAADAMGKAGSRTKPSKFRTMVATRAAYQIMERMAGANAVAQLHQTGEIAAAHVAERLSLAGVRGVSLAKERVVGSLFTWNPQSWFEKEAVGNVFKV